MKWVDSKLDSRQRLVAEDGEIVATVEWTYLGSWRLGTKEYIDINSARAAAERAHQELNANE